MTWKPAQQGCLLFGLFCGNTFLPASASLQHKRRGTPVHSILVECGGDRDPRSTVCLGQCRESRCSLGGRFDSDLRARRSSFRATISRHHRVSNGWLQQRPQCQNREKLRANKIDIDIVVETCGGSIGAIDLDQFDRTGLL
jgi:hypothetical protein